ncbi:hypothetical protein Bca4012_009305 [Brassica carinata]
MMETRCMKEPPHNILTNEDVEFLMSIQEWKNEIFVCVTSGALGVAKYQFLCRTPYTIGDTTYLGEGITEEHHLAAINEELEVDEFKCNGRVLREIFSEEKLVLLYRCSFEIEKAKKTSQLKPNQSNGEGKRIQPTEGNVGETSGRRSIAENYSEDATFFQDADGEMNVDREYWETGETEGCDDIINLSSDLNFEDDLSPLCDNDVVDIDGSSTGSTPICYDVNRDTEMRSGYIRNGKERRRIVRAGNEEGGNPIEYINTESEAERSDSPGRMNSHGNAEDICSGIRGSNGW